MAWGARSSSSTSDYVKNTTSPVLTTGVGHPFTFSGWFNASALSSSYGAILTVGQVSANLGIWAKSSGKMAYYIGTLTNQFLDPGSISVSTNTWYHVALSQTTSPSATAYVNGAVDGTISSPAAMNSTGWWTLNDVGNENLVGATADIAIWNVDLTALEIKALAAGERPARIRPVNLLVWCPNSGLVSPEPDLSGNLANGALTGSPAAAFGPPLSPIKTLVNFDQVVVALAGTFMIFPAQGLTINVTGTVGVTATAHTP